VIQKSIAIAAAVDGLDHSREIRTHEERDDNIETNEESDLEVKKPTGIEWRSWGRTLARLALKATTYIDRFLRYTVILATI
jgi:hypothetical protein